MGATTVVKARPARPPSPPETSAPLRTGRVPTGPGRRRRRAGMLMVAPALLHASLWIGLPVVVSVALAFTKYDVLTAPEFVGLDNFRDMLDDAVFRKSIVNTLLYTFFTVPFGMALGLLVALALHTGLKARGIFRTAVFLPQVTATVAIALVWLWIYNPGNGLLNTMLAFLGVDGPAWLSSTTWALPSVILVGIWQGIGMKMLIYLAALQSLPRELYEAASVDGASRVRQFFSITLPLLKPATFFVLITSMISAFQSFDQIYILTDGGPANSTTMMTYEIYKSAFREFRVGYASAQSLVLFVLLMGFTLVNKRIMGGSRGHN
ncbi:multiple sugar transport system permease protein [Streptomyces sp. LamerLS-316]|uniref:carbohydrate ABC transporter permease n=1 Tax=unclassified Streptomyces TaxID=2593676 RepID=UPI0008239490|nr:MULTISPECIES: sugar ABC transporter permease [unclassified Streptomyces]MDX3054879.1 sugar ABC transporter permease [Streptomyces sp. NE06-03E]MDX3428231.1 sugar ABC transporter permease [Streptomyces sp. ME01-18a]MDX3684497.1 sugar ABC transporter permease [Streptomyces sp. AK04-4c]RPK36635.1 sn-glycerol-3-phosphate transport system permease protein UgpA [Streptomyces sp. ADI93-02]SCK06041.1 multiple sugar transport system permease protein [Streptomyces sp. LamerLS-316]